VDKLAARHAAEDVSVEVHVCHVTRHHSTVFIGTWT